MKFLRMISFAVILAGGTASGWGGNFSEQDRAIEKAALESYVFRTLLEGRVQISVDAGVATLTGLAHDKALRALATDTVEGLAGVSDVSNRMRLDTSITEYSDTWIALRVRNSLLISSGFDATRIHVRVRDQVVTLTGAVVGLEQKQLVEKIVLAVKWVRSVSNELAVEAHSPAAASMDATVDDVSISAMLTYRLRDERLIALDRTKISTREGVVSISGYAASESERTLILRCAMEVRGAISVVNRMLVKNESAAYTPELLP